MKFTVFGASGATGRLVVERLLRRDDEVTALVRDPAKLGITNPRLHARVGDAFNLADVDSAIAGGDAVISLLGTRLDQPVDKIRTEGTSNIVEAMHAHGVRRLVAVSGVGGSNSAGQMGALTRWLYRKKVGAERYNEIDRLEQLLAESDVDWTVIRPPRLVDSKVDGSPTVAAAPKVSMAAFLTRDDLADILVEQATRAGQPRTALTAISAKR